MDDVLDVEAAEALRLLVQRLEAAGIECHVNDSGFHRTDGPAMLYPDGREEWYRNGVFHREDGPAICGGAVQAWYRDGVRHRVDGPAYVTSEGREEWFLNGVRHRDGGPAIHDPEQGDQWFLNGEAISPLDDRRLGVADEPGASFTDLYF